MLFNLWLTDIVSEANLVKYSKVNLIRRKNLLERKNNSNCEILKILVKYSKLILSDYQKQKVTIAIVGKVNRRRITKNDHSYLIFSLGVKCSFHQSTTI